jgi:transposase
MSIPKQDRQATFLDTGFLAQDLFDANDRYEIFRREILPAVQNIRGLLCELYCQDNGRPGIEPVLMAGITLLQFMENVPDRKALENVRLHLGWKHALDLKIDYRGFHPTSLVTFRQRLTEHKNGRLIFDGILQALYQQGLVKRRGKQRLDSTHILGAVAQMGRLEVVRETVRLFLETVEQMGLQSSFRDWVLFNERYIDCDIAWHKVSKETLVSKFLQAGHDMLALIQWARAYPSVLEHKQDQLLQRVFEEQYELTDQGPQRRKHEGSGVARRFARLVIPVPNAVVWKTRRRARWITVLNGVLIAMIVLYNPSVLQRKMADAC